MGGRILPSAAQFSGSASEAPKARYRNFDNVYAAIFMIGVIGFGTDLLLAKLGTLIFPWKRQSRSAKGTDSDAILQPVAVRAA